MLFNKDELKTYGSGFSGIGGFEFGIESVLPNAECLFYSEIEPFAVKSYNLLLPHHAQKALGDITKIDEKKLPNIDFLVGGFPCQAFSIAGRQLGFLDTRGTLFFELARIAKEKRPKMLLFENVKALITHDDYKTLQVILKTLNEIGYYVQYNVLNSRFYGVPQNRERIFILAVRKDLVEQGQWVIPKRVNKVQIAEKTYEVIKQPTVLDKSYKLSKENEIETFLFEWPEGQEPVDIKTIEDTNNIHYFTLERQKRMLYGNEEFWNELIDTLEEDESVFIKFNKERILRLTDTSNCITARDYKGPSKQEMTGVAKKVNGQILIRPLNEVESYRLQGYSNDQIKLLKDNKVSRTQMIKQAGNAVTINVIAAIMKAIIKD